MHLLDCIGEHRVGPTQTQPPAPFLQLRKGVTREQEAKGILSTCGNLSSNRLAKNPQQLLTQKWSEPIEAADAGCALGGRGIRVNYCACLTLSAWEQQEVPDACSVA
ncbi:hypothetical protein T265_03820 [Opisthorchis viverrini]|uniref:Uncharacterized protein n=1 Tax=Opisthorchis viverrini TaxID=6198 RepID=A0A074ZUV1_OPIVI|nr:hypothetical protein T265_03820 [Opisthorchis viverrini]KER29622.1 hypothetical protein T265_03820 [Opisthorchis viverrini]